MKDCHRSRRLRDERGVALPTAMFVMVLLLSLTIAFSTLATTEPVIGRNQELTSRARSLAESGLERAIWALSNPDATAGIPASMGATAAAPYDGATFIEISSLGGFTINVTQGAESHERNVVALGWTNDPASEQRGAVRKIEAVVQRVRWGLVNAPCALCALGSLDVGEGAYVDARANHCTGGSAPQGGTMTTGDTAVFPVDAAVWGPGNDTANEPAPPDGVSPDLPSFVDVSSFNFKLSREEFVWLRSRAQAQGQYYQGSQTFDEGRPLPNGLVVVDTTTGAEYTSSTPITEAANLTINGTLTWKGWLIVAGSVSISGTVSFTGTVYGLNDFLWIGDGEVSGLVVTENRQTSLTTVMSGSGLPANVRYHCDNARTGGGEIATSGYALKTGTYREVNGT